MTNKKKIRLLICAAILLALVAWTVWSNITLDVTEYTIQSQEIPTAFDGFRIAQVSDLHNSAMGKPGGKLLAALQGAQPDIIAITGDMIDSRHTDIPAALEFAAEAVKIAPCYYVPGNHESRISEYETLKQGLLDLGVTVLENEKVEIHHSGETINLLGVMDPSFEADYWQVFPEDVMDKNVGDLSQESGFTILLSHRPEMVDIYAQHSIDLALSGHAHGGQVRLPFVGAVYAPGQGLFPKYDAGLFEKENTTMIVSRGIGNSVIPLRFHNPPELVLITLTQ